jgi:hypothetical protein
MARRLIGGPCAALLTAGIAIVAVPQALGAGVRTAPAASGSLERTDRDCSTDREMDLLTTYCDYSYFTASGFADDPKTYLVDWVQIAVQPRRGWCLANAWIHAPAGLERGRLDSQTSRYRRAQLDAAFGHLTRPLAWQREAAVSAEPRRHLSHRQASLRWGSVFLALARPQPRQGAH